MGTWGSGNFDSDYALDWFETEILTPLIKRIEGIIKCPVACEWDEEGEGKLMPAVELLALLLETYGRRMIDQPTVDRWKATYLGVFDKTFHTADATPEFNAERRDVIVKTFDRLSAALKDG